MRTKKLLVLLLAFLLILPCFSNLIACGGNEGEKGVVVQLSRTGLNMIETDNPFALSASVSKDGNRVENPVLVWVSSDESVVTVDNGKVSPVGVGEATVTCTFEGASAVCAVSVAERTDYVEISTAEQFITAMSSGENRAYKLVNDIVITDKTLDTPTKKGNFQSGEHCFDVDFCGQLNGNFKKVIFNLENRSLGKAFNGVFKSISGIIKKTNFVICIQTALEKSGEYGIFTAQLDGKIDQCIITYDTYLSTNNVSGSVNQARSTPILSMGADAEISRTIVRREKQNGYYDYSRLCEYQLVKHAKPTSKITNVIIVGNRWGYTGNATSTSQVRFALPQEKCQVNGFWLFETYGDAGVVNYLKSGKFTFRLDQEKYDDPTTPANVTMAGKDITSAEYNVLYTAQEPYTGGKYDPVPVSEYFGYGFQIEFLTMKYATYKSGKIDQIHEDADVGRIVIDFFS